jgi:hypothetical protein
MNAIDSNDVVSTTLINNSTSIETANRKIIAIKINIADGMANNVVR